MCVEPQLEGTETNIGVENNKSKEFENQNIYKPMEIISSLKKNYMACCCCFVKSVYVFTKFSFNLIFKPRLYFYSFQLNKDKSRAPMVQSNFSKTLYVCKYFFSTFFLL